MQGSVNGYVVRADDRKPVSGASIVLEGKGAAAPDISVVTDNDGYFAFDGLPSGDWKVRAFGPNGGSGEATVPVFDNAVSDVMIAIDGLNRWLKDAIGGVTDASSDVASQDAGSDLPVQTAARPDEYAPDKPSRAADKLERRKHPPKPAKKTPDIAAGKTPRAVPGSLRGRVLLADTGMPVANAAVSVVSGPGSAPDIAPLTDAAGRFAFDGLPPGSWLLRAVGPEGESGEAEVRIYDNAVADVVIELVRRTQAVGTVLGRVVRADTGTPIADATVTVVMRGEVAPDISPVTDSAGRFVLKGVPVGTWAFRATSSDGRSGEAELTILGSAPIHLTIEIDGRLFTLGRIEGRFVMADTGMPIAGATISLVSGPRSVPDVTPLTDASGRFSFDALPTGTWRLSALGENGERGESMVEISLGGVTDVTLTADRPTLASDLLGRQCRIYYPDETLTDDIVEYRANIELNGEDQVISRIWFG